MSGGASNEPRTAYADIVVDGTSIPFRGKSYALNFIKTGFGGFLFQGGHIAGALNDTEGKVASENFRTVANNCSQLKHNDQKLEDHVQVKISFVYLQMALGEPLES